MSDDTQTALDAGMLIGDAKEAPGGVIPYAVHPDDASVTSLEHLLEQPARIRRGVTFATLESFVDYVKVFQAAEEGRRTAIFGDPVTVKLEAILDYHDSTRPAWCEHGAVYAAPKSLEWTTWTGMSGKVMGQGEFAQHLEDNLVDIRNPPGADILEVCRSLKAKKSVEFTSAIDLSNGSEQFTYNENITSEAGARRSNLTVPRDFNLGIPVLLGGEVYAVVARLRYRITEGKLALWYELYRPQYIVRAAFADIVKEVEAQTGVTVWQGAS